MYAFLRTVRELTVLILWILLQSMHLASWLLVRVIAPSLKALWRGILQLAAYSAESTRAIHDPADSGVWTQSDSPDSGAWGPSELASFTMKLSPRDEAALNAVRSTFATCGTKSVTIPDPESALAPRPSGREPAIPLWVELLRREVYKVVWTEQSTLNCPGWVVTQPQGWRS